MGQMIRCPLIGVSCGKQINVEEKSFFLAEAEKPEDDRKRRTQAISGAISAEYKIRSALEEKDINAFTCKICEMIQTCAYGIADVTDNNPNVLLELGMMIALGKPTIILSKKGQEGLNLPSDLKAIEVIPFTEYIDTIEPMRKIVQKLPPPFMPPKPIEDLQQISPQCAVDLQNQLNQIVTDFKKSMEQAKLDTVVPREERKEIPAELGKSIARLEEKLDRLTSLGLITDAKTAFLRGNYYYSKGKYNEALACYNWALELKPDDPATLMNRGVTYAKLERYEEALVDYNRSLELKPDDPATLTNRGVTYAKLERYEEALADYNRPLELRPDDPATLTNRGVAYAKLEKYKEALADFNRSLELTPDDPGTFYNMACLFSLQRKTDDALV